MSQYQSLSESFKKELKELKNYLKNINIKPTNKILEEMKNTESIDKNPEFAKNFFKTKLYIEISKSIKNVKENELYENIK